MLTAPSAPTMAEAMPNLRTKIIPAKIPWLKISGKVPKDMSIPPLWDPES